MALIIVLSGFNGLQLLVENMYSNFDPEIKVFPAKGKTFEESSVDWEKLESLEAIKGISKTLEETALLKYKDKQSFAVVKGVSENFGSLSGLDTSIYEGNYSLEHQGRPFASMGYGVAGQLQVYTKNIFDPVVIFAANREASMNVNPMDAFTTNPINVSSIFNVNADVDFKYVIVPLAFAQKTFKHEGRLSTIEIRLKEGVSPDDFVPDLKAVLGPGFDLKTRFELNELLFKTNRTEKWITYLILTFILVIASFNLIASLTILIIEKRSDIAILRAMGADKKLITKTFLREGFYIAALGGGIGMGLGLLLTLGQQYIGFLRLGADSIVEYYPVALNLMDFITVLGTVLVLGFLASWLPVHFMLRKTLV